MPDPFNDERATNVFILLALIVFSAWLVRICAVNAQANSRGQSANYCNASYCDE